MGVNGWLGVAGESTMDARARVASSSAPQAQRPAPARERGGIGRFGFASSFIALSIGSILGVSLFFALLLERFVTDRMLALDVQMTTEFVNQLFGIGDAERYFGDPSTAADNALTEFLAQVGRMPDVLRANIYRLDGTVLWSTDRSLVGRRFPDNHSLAAASAGTPISTLEPSEDKPEHVDLRGSGEPFVENYIPVFRGGQSGAEVIGVLEVYRSPQALLDTIAAGRRLIFGFALAGALAIVGTLWWLVRRAERTLRRQEAEIAAAERLATAGEMASAVAHGLRNPLASIRSSAELASRLRSPERVQELLDDIMAQSDRLEHWVRQYLSMVEPHASGQRCDLASVLTGVRANFESELERHAILWQVSLPPDLPAIAVGPVLLEQVLNGIVTNAIQAMPEGGELAVTGRKVEDGAVELWIADSGQGMTPEQLERAFQPFATTKPTGLGLGLALARRILERHGASIAIRSEPGRGTVVALRLPAAPA